MRIPKYTLLAEMERTAFRLLSRCSINKPLWKRLKEANYAGKDLGLHCHYSNGIATYLISPVLHRQQLLVQAEDTSTAITILLILFTPTVRSG